MQYFHYCAIIIICSNVLAIGPRRKKPYWYVLTLAENICSKRTTFNRRTTNYQAWKEQMTICDLLEGYDPAVRPFGQNPALEKSKISKDCKYLTNVFHSLKPNLCINLDGPVIVRTSLYIQSISAVSERNMVSFIAFSKIQKRISRSTSFSSASSKSGSTSGYGSPTKTSSGISSSSTWPGTSDCGSPTPSFRMRGMDGTICWIKRIALSS